MHINGLQPLRLSDSRQKPSHRVLPIQQRRKPVLHQLFLVQAAVEGVNCLGKAILGSGHLGYGHVHLTARKRQFDVARTASSVTTSAKLYFKSANARPVFLFGVGWVTFMTTLKFLHPLQRSSNSLIRFSNRAVF